MDESADVLLAQIRGHFREAIRMWINVDINKTYPLTGGVSGASVHYVSANLSFPGVSANIIPVNFVIKFSGKRTFEKEQEIYNSLRDDLKPYFINFSAVTRQISSEFCMVMEHLKDFQPLEFLVYETPLQVIPKDLMRKVISTLNSIQRSTLEKANVSSRFHLYFAEIEQSILRALRKHGKLGELYDKEVHVNGLDVTSLKQSFRKITENSDKFEPPFLTLMHGDCHARNIMINPKTLELKFIDIDQLTKEGDYIYDFGELLADMEIFGFVLGARRFKVTCEENNSYLYRIELPQAVSQCGDAIMNELLTLAKDDNVWWEKRLMLAKARYLLSMLSNLGKNDEDRVLATYLEAARIMSEISASLCTK